MIKKFLFLLTALWMIGGLLGCVQEQKEDMKQQINFVPNEEYSGDPNPIVKEDMKLTDQERKEFEAIKEEILTGKGEK